MRPGEPIMEKSRSEGNFHHMRLMALLREMVRDKGPRGAAEVLDVDHRTLMASMEGGELSRRVRVALERALLSGGGSAAARQRQELDALRQQVEALAEETQSGLQDVRDAIEGEVKALREEQAQGMWKLEGRVASLEARQAAQGAGEAKGALKQPTKKAVSQRREYPDLATREAAPDDEEVFGAAWPLIAEWRKLKDSHPNQGKSLSWLATEERFLAVELALLEEHGLTPASGEASAEGPRSQRADQLAKDGSLRRSEGAVQAGAAQVGTPGADPEIVVEVDAFGVRRVGNQTFVEGKPKFSELKRTLWALRPRNPCKRRNEA